MTLLVTKRLSLRLMLHSSMECSSRVYGWCAEYALHWNLASTAGQFAPGTRNGGQQM
jgi:hypothetical protein